MDSTQLTNNTVLGASPSSPTTVDGATDWQLKYEASEQELLRLRAILKDKDAELQKGCGKDDREDLRGLKGKKESSNKPVTELPTLSTFDSALTDEMHLRVTAELVHADAEKASAINRGNRSHEQALQAAEYACLYIRLLRAITANAIVPEAKVIGSLHNALLTHDDRRDGFQKASDKILRLGTHVQQLAGMALRALEKVELITDPETPLRRLHNRSALGRTTQEIRTQTMSLDDLIKAVTDKSPSAPTTLEKYVPLDHLRFGRLSEDPERIVQIEAALMHKHQLRTAILASRQTPGVKHGENDEKHRECLEKDDYGYEERNADYLLARTMMTGLDVADVLAGRIPAHIIATVTGSPPNIADAPTETTVGAHEPPTANSVLWWDRIAEEVEAHRPGQIKMICETFELTAEEVQSLNGPLLTAMILRASRTLDKWNAQQDVMDANILSVTFGRQVVRRAQRVVRRVLTKSDNSSSSSPPRHSPARRRDPYTNVAHRRRPSVPASESPTTAKKQHPPPLIIQGLTEEVPPGKEFAKMPK